VSLSKYEDNSDPIPRPTVVLATCNKALVEVLLAREGEVEEVPVPIPVDELEATAPSDVKILLQVVFFLPTRWLLCRNLQSHCTELTIILFKYGCKLNSYLSEVSRIISTS